MGMIKKLIALSVVLLLPITFISSASAASKSVTCYKGTASKVVKNSTGKCPSGWSSKKPAVVNGANNSTENSYKIQDISTVEVSTIIDALNKIGKLNALILALTNGMSSDYHNCVASYKENKDKAAGASRLISHNKASIIKMNEQIAKYRVELQKINLTDLEKNNSKEILTTEQKRLKKKMYKYLKRRNIYLLTLPWMLIVDLKKILLQVQIIKIIRVRLMNFYL